MQRLHSTATFFWKTIFPWTILATVFFFFFATIYYLFWQGTIVIIIIGAMLVGIFRNLLMNLKSVYLDETNRQLIVKHHKNEIPIKLSNIKKVDKIVLSITLIDIKLKDKTELGYDFTFMPNNTYFIWSQPEKKINELIKSIDGGKNLRP